jgi:hybrid polyketide synthase/nonribosomal peptide synthetase ACE1
MDAVSAVSESLGFLWSHQDKVHVDLDTFERVMSGTSDFNIIKDLPTYKWNHDSKYWHESRQSRAFRQPPLKTHPLLGDATTDSSAHQLIWRNLLRARELPWVNGHQLQGKTVFPAAGYVVTALEASKALANTDGISLIDIQDFSIRQAIVLEEDDDGVEIIVNLSNVDRSEPDTIRAQFTYSAAANKDTAELALVATANVTVSCGQRKIDGFPERGPNVPHLVDVPEEMFYSALADLGYNYSGDFRALSLLRRKLGKATGSIRKASSDEMGQTLLIHPSTLDCALQSVILAYSYPSDGCLWSLHVPTSISRIRVRPTFCGSGRSQQSQLMFESSTVASDGPGIYGDVEIYAEDETQVAFQIEGMRAVPFTAATEADDKKIFSTFVWDQLDPDGDEVASDDEVTQEHRELASVLDRVATFFFRQFQREPVPDSFKHYLNYAKYVNQLQREGKHAFAKQEWLNDTLDDIIVASEK